MPDYIQEAIFHWYSLKETTIGEALLPVETSYAEVYARFRWHIPTYVIGDRSQHLTMGRDLYAEAVSSAT
jgi:hypothetical protein